MIKKTSSLQLFKQKEKIIKAENKVYEEKKKLNDMLENAVVNCAGEFITVNGNLYSVKVKNTFNRWSGKELTIEKIGNVEQIEKALP